MCRICALLLTLSLALAACGSTAAPAGRALTVDAHEFGFTPSSLDLTVGETVTITLKNSGAVDHDFSVQVIALREPAASNGASHAPGSGHSHGASGADGAPALHVAALPGQSGTLTFTPTAPGIYEVECTVPGHREAGMVAELVVKSL